VSNGLGLSVGETNLVVAPAAGAAQTTRSILTVYPDRAPEVGATAGLPTPGGLVLTGFVERVGDTRPLVAADGSAHSGETVLAEALDTLVRSSGNEPPTAIAVPAHWGLQSVSALRGALRGKPTLAGAPLVPDSTAALAGLRSGSELPDHGVVALLDFGGSGTSISLADAGAGDALIGSTVRYPEFSGDAVDQALLNHVIAGLSESGALEAQLAANADDHQARYDLAMVYNAEGKKLQAAEQLVTLMRRDRTWNDDGARKKLLELFEAWGPKDPATTRGRRLLSALLFA